MIFFFFRVPNEIAIQIVRNSIKKMNYMSDLERTEVVELFKDVFDRYDPITMQKNKEYSYNLTPTDYIKDYRDKIWTQLNPELYTMFWLFTLDDIFVPQERYDGEIEKINKEVQKLEENKNQEAAGGGKGPKSKAEKEIDKLKSSIEKLKDENMKLVKKKENIEQFIVARKEKIFEIPNDKKKSSKISPYFIQVNEFNYNLLKR